MMPGAGETESGAVRNVGGGVAARVAADWRLLTHPLAVLLALSLLTAVIYSNTVTASFQFDDFRVIVDNPVIKNLSNFLDVSDARYVGDLSFALNYRAGGLAVAGYHGVNILIHAANGFLVYLLGLLLFRASTQAAASHQPQRPVSASPNRSQGAALFASFLFLAHPIQTQAVTYIVQRFTSLATLFCLLTVVCYLQWRLTGPAGRGRFLWYAGALLCTLLAMKTKEVSFALPLLVVLVETIFFRPLTGKQWLALVPFLVTLAILPLVHWGALHAAATQGMSAVPASGLGAPDTVLMHRWAAVLTQVRAAMTYLRLLVWPVHQNLDYDYPVAVSFFQPAVALSALALAGCVVLILRLLRRSEWSTHHAPRQLMAFGLLWFFLILSLEAAFYVIAGRDAVIEHRLYLPSVGFFVAAGAAGSWASQRMPDRVRWVAIGLAVGAVALLSVATYQRNMVWRDALSLWSDVVRKSPGKARPHDNLGVALRRRGDLKGAIAEYRTALRIDPGYANAHDNLGVALYVGGDLEGAIAEYREALRLNPDNANAYENLGVALYDTGDLEGAIAAYRDALRLDPNAATAHYYLAIALMDQGDGPSAEAAFRRFLQIAPDGPSMRRQIADAKSKLGKLGGAGD